ncbi:MAG TPA: YoaK family protein, partial [Thermoanaerobaculia bacterium]|nr:YoaK family protein [Thermoanaerobaculia bacterium]
MQADADDAKALEHWDRRIPRLLSVIAGLVDVTGFYTLGNILTAHITGNLVIVSASLVRREPLYAAQVLAIPVFVLALTALWLIAWTSRKNGLSLARVFLWLQFLLIFTVFVFSVIAKPSANPHGLTAGIAAMLAISAMACQYALFRLAIPEEVTTASMTGNLTNATLAFVDHLSRRRPLLKDDAERMRTSLNLLFGFLAGCAVAAVAVL